jgi:hypothetical protein
MAISLSNGQDGTTSALSDKFFSITKSVLYEVDQKALTLITSDKKTIAHFREYFELQKTLEKKLPLPSMEVCTESDEQKERRLEIKSAAREAQKLLGQEVADDIITQPTVTVSCPPPPVEPPSFSLYQSRLFWAGACTVGAVALAIGAFYYPHTGHFLKLCKDFFTSSARQNIVLPTEPTHIEVNAVQT